MLVWNFLAPSPPWCRLICQDVIFKIRALQHWVTTQSSVISHSPNVQTLLTLAFRLASDLRSSGAIVELKSGDWDTMVAPFIICLCLDLSLFFFSCDKTGNKMLEVCNLLDVGMSRKLCFVFSEIKLCKIIVHRSLFCLFVCFCFSENVSTV